MTEFKHSIQKQLKSIQQESTELSDFLVEHQARKFAHYHRLLSVPLSKLSEEEKAHLKTLLDPADYSQRGKKLNEYFP